MSVRERENPSGNGKSDRLSDVPAASIMLKIAVLLPLPAKLDGWMESSIESMR